MQPVLLGRSFAPLQGETGLCTAEMRSNRPNHPALPNTSVEGGKKDKRHEFFLLLGSSSVPRRRVWVNSEGPGSFFTSEECIIVLICNFNFMHAGEQIHNCKNFEPASLPPRLFFVLFWFFLRMSVYVLRRAAANSLQPIPFPCVIHT